MPLRTVSVTLAPTRMEPASSQIAPMMTALRMVMAPDPTASPMELAKSFAPMVHAR